MTYAAFGIHKRLVESEGFDPNSEDYYTELDRRIADEFPHKVGKSGQQSARPVQTVASASRTAKKFWTPQGQIDLFSSCYRQETWCAS